MKKSSSYSSNTSQSSQSEGMRRKTFVLEKSENKLFLWKITYEDHNIHFGNPKMKNYTMNRCAKERLEYIKSHETYWEEDDFETRDFWERWLLFNKSTMEKSIEDVERRFQIRIEYKKKEHHKGITLPKSFKNVENRLVKEIISI